MRLNETAPLALTWAAFVLPPILLLAHGLWREGLLGALGGAMVLAGVGLVAGRYGETGDPGPDAGLVAIQLAGCSLLLAALVLAHRAPRALPPVRARLPVAGLVGVLLLGFSWWFGGQAFLLLPLWVLAPIALAGPALLRARAAPWPAVLSVVLLAAGAFVPASECTYPFVTDHPEPDDPDVDRVETATVWQAAGRGPWWHEDDLFASYPVRCEPRLPALAAGWLVALVAVAWLPWPRLLRAPRRP